MFPGNNSYSCPAGPCLSLECKFPAGASPILWSYPGISSISSDELGHVIDNSMRSRGLSFLNVSRSSYLKELYRCIAILPNGTSRQWTRMTRPTASKLPHSSSMHKCLSVYEKACPSLCMVHVYVHRVSSIGLGQV